ncbi:SusC/RagA family TonB-linked outer membrane protein [Mucilaginibacter sp. McL0603]|uniref:SusC/RagA family TonB-linked outer membrane protein n=1 Tax=Mucilaginibacter sp. McL0603 TaxID=3415670 RepID=UPI003CEFE777
MKSTLRFSKVWCLTALCLLFLSETHAAEHRNVAGMLNNISPNKKALEQAQIKGIVKDETGLPLPGVSVKIKGTSTGTQTGVDGSYTLNAQTGDVLVFTYVGYLVKEVTVGTGDTANVTLTPDSKNLNEVVVTALGITKSSASISYDQQTVSGKELQVAKSPSFINSLDGKVSGLQITQSSSGAGGSTKVVLRGNKSIAGNNNVLYVVDGVPLNPLTSGQPNGPFSYGPDGGDGISNINPDDIESMSVLKGASASALYGSAAANGVILITTKKGKAGKTSVTLNSSTTFDKAVLTPKLQTTYARGDTGVTNNTAINSWGAKEVAGSPNFQPSEFFKTGVNAINSFSLSTGSDKNQTFISYANTHSTGIEPNNSFTRNNITVHNTTKLLSDKMTLDVNASYIFQNTVDRPGVGTYFNPLTSTYLFPRGTDFNQYKNFESYDPTRNIQLPNWITPYNNPGAGGDALQNPYWIQYRNLNNQGLNRLLATVLVKYEFNSWLNLQARVSLDKADQTSDQKLFAGSTTLLSGLAGNYTYTSSGSNQVYSDLLLNFNRDLSHDFNINGTLGASIQDNQNSSLGFGGKLGNIPNFFNVSNLSLASGNPFNQTTKQENQVQSVFASVDLNYKKYLFLDITGRTDWSSTLGYTVGNSFFYPSVGLSDVLSSMFKMPDFISFSKLRVSYSDVGNGLLPYAAISQYPITNGSLSFNLTAPFPNLKPEKTSSFEVGTEWRFFNDHLSFDATYYHTNTHNQLFNVPAPIAGGYSNYYVNGGNVRNEGFEGSLGYKGKIAGDLQWNSTVTFSLNRNKVLALFTDATGTVHNEFEFGNAFDSYSLQARVGQPYGEIYAKDFKRDASGNVVVVGGLPQLQDTPNGSFSYKDVGNPSPRFSLGWTNTFKLSNFDLAFTIDGRFGGTVLDMTGAYLDQYGVSQASANARNATDGSQPSLAAVQKYYQVQGGRTGALATYAYSATNVRFREAALGYTFPGSVFNNKIENIRVALTGRNLFFFYLKAPFDPETTLSTNNTLQGIDLFGQPSVRTLGFNVSARF